MFDKSEAGKLYLALVSRVQWSVFRPDRANMINDVVMLGYRGYGGIVGRTKAGRFLTSIHIKDPSRRVPPRPRSVRDCKQIVTALAALGVVTKPEKERFDQLATDYENAAERRSDADDLLSLAKRYKFKLTRDQRRTMGIKA